MQILQVPIFQTAFLWRAMLPAKTSMKEALHSVPVSWCSHQRSKKQDLTWRMFSTDNHWPVFLLEALLSRDPFSMCSIKKKKGFVLFSAKILFYNKINNNGTLHLCSSLPISKCSFICKYLDSHPQGDSSASDTRPASRAVFYFILERENCKNIKKLQNIPSYHFQRLAINSTVCIV